MVNTPRAAMQAVQQKLAEAGLDSVQFESRILLETVPMVISPATLTNGIMNLLT